MTSSPCLIYGLNQKKEANNDFSFISLKCKSRDLSSDHIHALKGAIDGKASISLDFFKQGISRLAMVMKVVCTQLLREAYKAQRSMQKRHGGTHNVQEKDLVGFPHSWKVF